MLNTSRIKVLVLQEEKCVTKDDFDEKLEYTPDDEKESIAARAVAEALTAVRVKVLKKHKLRKDSWHRTTSPFSMNELSHNKMHRLRELYLKLLDTEVVKEITDELDDIIAYCAFQRHMLLVDKVANPYTVAEVDV